MIMSQIQKGITFTDTGAGDFVDATRLNNHVDDATLLKGAVTDQAAITATATDDYVLVSDTSDTGGALPSKVTLKNLAPETIRHQVPIYSAGVYGAGIYAITLDPVKTAYTAGEVVRFKADTANPGAVNVNVNSVGSVDLLRVNLAELGANDILANQIVEMVYDGTRFLLLTPSLYKYTSSPVALPGAASVATFAHGLGAIPSSIRVRLVQTNASAQNGYAQNEEVAAESIVEAGNSVVAFAISADATNITVAQRNNANLRIIPKTGGDHADMTEGNWNLKVYAQL
jgi:hypothetical protein